MLDIRWSTIIVNHSKFSTFTLYPWCSNPFQDPAGTGFTDVFTLFQALLRSVKDGHRVNGVLLTQYDLEAVV